MARRAAMKWKSWVGWIGGALFALALALIALNATSVPLRLARQFAEAFEAKTGLEIELSGARFVGPTHLRLDGVTFSTAGGERSYGEVAEVHLRIDLLQALRAGRDEGRWGSVDLIRPRLHLPAGALTALNSLGTTSLPSSAGADSGKAAPRSEWQIDVRVIDGTIEGEGFDGDLWRVEGRFTLGRGAHPFGVERVSLREESTGVALEATSASRGTLLEWRASGPAEALFERFPALPWSLSGEAAATGTATLDRGIQEVALTVSDGVVVWGSDPARDRTPFDRLELDMARETDWELRSIVLTQGEAVVRGEGRVRLPDAAQGERGGVELQVFADRLELPAGIAPLETYGFRGRSRFTGVLSGSFDDLELAGRLSIEKGSVWNRPVDRAEGVIQLERGVIRFGDAELVEGESHYKVSGEIAYENSPTQFQLELGASNGRVEEVLAAAGLEIDATGRFDGTLHFARSGEGMAVEGDIVRANGKLMGEAFERFEGNFRWTGGGLRLAHARAGLRGGVLALAGEIRGEALDFDVNLAQWPLEMDEAFPFKLPDGVSGWISYAGRLTGSLDAPVLTGELTGGDVAYGRLKLADPMGRLEITQDEARLEGVQVRGAGDGVYRLSGAIDEWRGEAPQLDLGIEVVTASLSGLFLEGGLDLPALLLDGNVTGEISVSGSAKEPKASFDLALSDDLGFGEPIRLRFDVENGKLRLGRSALASLLRR